MNFLAGMENVETQNELFPARAAFERAAFPLFYGLQ